MVTFVPTPVRDESLSSDQRDALRRWVRRHHTHESFEPPLLFALVVAGDKPATHITPCSWAFPGSQFETDSRVDPRERVEHDDFAPEEIAYTKLVFYRHDDSITGYERAIENGKTMRARFAKLAEHWGIPTLDQLAEEYYQLAAAVYAGEKEAFPGELTDFIMIAHG